MSDTEENPSALKHIYGAALLKRTGSAISAAYPAFDKKKLLALTKPFAALEMKSRVYLIRDELHRQLPSDYPKALAILLKSLKSGELSSFDLWPFTEFIQTYGLEHPDISVAALKEITKVFTSEFAVRPFIQRHPKQTMAFLLRCAKDKDVHVRRWSSEGTRPRLPWGARLNEFIKEPKLTLPILEQLKFDSELYVRKSVANHLNDIAKDHPDLVVQILKRWKKQAGAKHEDKIKWIIHRALRTLIKSGHPGALELIGVSTKAQIHVQKFKVKQPQLKLGDRLEFAFEIQSKAKKPQRLVVDYVLHFVKANKSLAAKVFKLRTFELPGGATVQFEKAHHIKRITTRVYYPGRHAIEIQINGTIVGRADWNLKV